MQNKSPRYHKAMNIVDVLEGSQFAKIMQKGLQINETNEKLRPLFPAELLPFLRFGNISNQTLFIEAANAMVRQSILFQQTRLLTQHITLIFNGLRSKSTQIFNLRHDFRNASRQTG